MSRRPGRGVCSVRTSTAGRVSTTATYRVHSERRRRLRMARGHPHGIPDNGDDGRATTSRSLMPRLRWTALPGDTPGTCLPADLPACWRSLADLLHRYEPRAAQAFRDAADDLEAALEREANEELSPEQIEAEGICSAETVRRKTRDGSVQNVGTPGRIKVRRGDLDRLPRARRRRGGKGPGGTRAGPVSSEEVARRVAVTTAQRRQQ